MPTFANGESAASVRTKINDAIDKVDGNAAITSVNIDGGAIDGVTLGTNSAVTEAQIDNININGNAIISTNTNGNIALTPNGTGEVDISKVDIDGGSIDGTTIGGASAAAATFTNVTANGTINFTGATVSNGGTVTTIDINGGSIDGTVIGGSTPAAISGTTGIFNLSSLSTSVNYGTPQLGVGNASNFSAFHVEAHSATAGNGPFIGLLRSDGTQSSPANLSSGSLIGTIQGQAFQAAGSFPYRVSASISFVADGAHSSTSLPGRIEFGTVESGSTTLAERMRISSGGDISFYEDTGTTPKFFWDASAEALGIGTTAPAVRMELNGATSNAEYLRVGGPNSASTRALRFSSFNSGADDSGHIINASSSAGVLAFQTNSTERMRIDSSGNLLVGKTATGLATVGVEAQADGDLWATTDSKQALTLRRNTTDGNIANFWKDNTTVGSIGVQGSKTYIGTGDAGLLFDNTNNRIDPCWPTNTGSTTNGTLDLGGAATRFKDLYLSGGVSNPAAGGTLTFGTVGSERMRIDASGNVLIGGTTAGTASAGNLVLVNGTAPTGNVTNGITLFAEDVSASSELKVRDEAGNVTTLSPHNFDLIPEGPSEEMAWSYYSERDGKRINVDMLKAIRLLEQITGEKLVHIV